MASIAVFLYPDRIGMARVKAAGYKPSYSSLTWKSVEDMEQLLTEPLILASTIREMVGDDKRTDVYLSLWNGAYNAIMFSHTKKNRGDLNRLRQAELETVFHGESNLSTYDLLLDKGRPNAEGKIRRSIYVMPGERVNLMVQTFNAQKLNLRRIAPVEAAAAEAALHFWAPAKESISACLVLDDACTSIIFLKNGCVQSVRTMPDGFHAVVKTYAHLSGLSTELARLLLVDRGLDVSDESKAIPLLQDDLLRMVSKLTAEVVKNVHSVFGAEAVLDNVLLCGEFAKAKGLKEKLDDMLQIDCGIADSATLPAAVSSAIALDDKDLLPLFHVGAATARGADLMETYKKAKSDKQSAILLCGVLGAAIIGFMCLTPIQKSTLEDERDAAAALLDQPEYVAVQELYDAKADLQRQKNNLASAIEALPHGGSNTAGIINDLSTLTADYGTLLAINVDYNGKTINLTFTTLNYDSFVLWQKAVLAEGRFSFVTPPTFEGNGLIYTVDAVLSATDFDTTLVSEEAAAEGTGEVTNENLDEVLNTETSDETVQED